MKQQQKTVAILCDSVSSLDHGAVDLLKKHGFAVRELAEGTSRSSDLFWELTDQAIAIIAGMEPYQEEILQKLPDLKVIARRGVGVDNIDLDACARHQITVTRTVGAVEHAVAELTMAFILQFAREIDPMSSQMKKHCWNKILSEGCYGKTLCFVGFGAIAQKTAQMATAFGMKIAYYSRHRNLEAESALHAKYLALDELLSTADYLSVNVPLTPQTKAMIGETELNQMKPDAVLINTARGPIVQEQALAEALRQGKLRGAAIDVFDQEPTTDSPLLDCPNIILTPHVGTYTRETFIKMNQMAAQSIVDYFSDSEKHDKSNKPESFA